VGNFLFNILAFLWRFCAFLNYRGVQKHQQKRFAEKIEKNALSLPFSPLIFLIAFLAVSLHEGLKNTKTYFPKSHLRTSKNLKTRQVGRYVVFSFSFLSINPIYKCPLEI
jgi:hypothetical protein